MNKNIIDLIENIKDNNGRIINNLIKGNVFTADYMVDFVVKNNKIRLISLVASFVEGISDENIKKLTDIIINSKDASYMYQFAKYNKKAPVTILADAVIEAKCAASILGFAIDVPNAPIDKLTDGIIATGSATTIVSFAKGVKGADINKLAEGVIATKKEDQIYNFAKDVENAPVDKLADAVIDIGTPIYILNFAKYVKNAPIDRLADGIIATKDLKSILAFKNEVRNAPREKLTIGVNRAEVESISDEKKMENLFKLADNNNAETISYSADIYRRLFENENVDSDLVLKAKTRVLKPNAPALKEDNGYIM